ncbi:cytochrome C oxidase subunit II [Sediminibacillus dalangtanensis]|uniref:Cytochrome C oxidase subunit II n=1 Tax=Sediminibacillus dalangtanensis TaxID=2729421 RepID=A0ABX7VMQ2_9BACI|nr:cupredoxin domain-containing protein [Sediminibacillus dalangtanensis]QTM98107.1 cytochrome C oxidase subunit II [Sediminibacillus dalangtanensis]
MRKKILIVAVLGMLVLLLAACGSSSDDESGETKQESDENTTEETTTGDGGMAEEGSSDNTLNISATNFKFDQEEYTVQSGEEVTINLTSEEGNHGLAIDEFDVNIEGDGTATFTPEEPGEYEIYCSVPCGEGHSDMKSTLVVQ